MRELGDEKARKLKPIHRHELNALHEKVSALNARRKVLEQQGEIRCLAVKCQTLQLSLDILALERKRTSIDGMLRDCGHDLEKLRERLNKSYGLDFSMVAYDDKTGVITPLEPEEQEDGDT